MIERVLRTVVAAHSGSLMANQRSNNSATVV